MGKKSSVKGVLVELPTPILPNICRELTIEALIDLHLLISGNTVSVVSNLGQGRHGHLVMTMTCKEYTAQTGYAFFPQHNPGNYPPTMRTAQEQVIGTEKFRQKQALFRKYTAVDVAIKTRSSRRWNHSSCPHWWTS